MTPSSAVAFATFSEQNNLNILFFKFITMMKPIHRPDVKHYANKSMQYTVIFHNGKNNNFQRKNCDTFLIFAQNIDRGYTLEPPH